ncbi:MAG: aspartate/glutamate racemase family protein [Betaproteobacteria bacterium]
MDDASRVGTGGRAPVRIALIHALAHSVAPVNDELARAWPEAVRMNLLDDSLSADLARTGSLDSRMTERFLALADYAFRTGAAGILFTCSAFGPCIDAVARRWPAVPVLKPNEAMIDEAVTLARAGHGRIALVATFAPTLASMPDEFPRDVALVPVFVDGAMAALDRGDGAALDRLAAEAVSRLARDGVDAIALGQFSLARAADAVAQAAGIPVLTTPGSAVRALRSRLAGAQRPTAAR